jgi:Cu/Ag efflux protein CusF
MTSKVGPILHLTAGRFLAGKRNAGGAQLKRSTRGSGRARRMLACGLPFLLIFVFAFQAAKAQSKRKVPIVSKLTSGGSKQAFSGKVQSVDLKLHVLELNAKESKSLEIFPIKKSVTVTTADGERMRLSELKPGNQVIVYYEQKGDRRTVKDIVLLTEGTAEKPKKSAPPS